MKDIDCCELVEKCPRFKKCSVPLCPLDQDVETRIYLEGEPTCKLGFERLTAIVDDGFKEQYRIFERVSLGKEARFKPLKQITTRRKNVQKTSSLK